MSEIRLDSGAVKALLLSLHQPVKEAADAVAAKLRAEPDVARASAEAGHEVVNVRAYTTDRAGAVVNVDHWAGQLMQHKGGVLSRAVTATGLRFVGNEEDAS